MDLITLNDRYVPQNQCGFYNQGATCYFNALMQALLSCSSLNEVVENIPIQDISTTNDSSAITAYKQVLTAYKTSKCIHLNELWQYLNIDNGQQCAAEGYQRLIDSLKCIAINRLVATRYENIVKCASCGWVNQPSDNNNVIFIPADITKDAFKQYICNHNAFTDTIHRCSKCDATGTKPYESSLMLVSEIIVIIAKKYNNNGQKILNTVPFMSHIEFNNANGGIFQYKAIAQVEHMGSLHGGHYTATCMRHNKWYMFNDSGVSKIDITNFTPTPNTYMVFYHIIS